MYCNLPFHTNGAICLMLKAGLASHGPLRPRMPDHIFIPSD